VLTLEYRGYFGLDPAIPRNLIAVWFLAQTTVTGQLPYLGLPAIGWDSKNRTGRGYVQGRFRGTAELYGEVEYRFRLTNNGLVGGAVFFNVETFSSAPVSYLGFFNQGENLFEHLRPAGGVGLRFMMSRQSRTNITVDFSVAEKTFGRYIGAGLAPGDRPPGSRGRGHACAVRSGGPWPSGCAFWARPWRPLTRWKARMNRPLPSPPRRR
jgi:hypothetical protein